MRLTIDLETDQLTDRDRRVLAALIGDDNSPLVLPRFPGTDNGASPAGEHPTPAPPLPVPVPPAFAAKLGEAVGKFSGGGSGPEARLPFARQAGVRTSSTMPDDDEPSEVVDADAVVDEPSEVVDVDGLQVIRARGRVSVPRAVVEDDVDPRRPEDFTRDAILGVVEQPPVRHTSP